MRGDTMAETAPSLELLDAPVSFFRCEELVEFFEEVAASGCPTVVMHRNLHGAHIQRKHPDYSVVLRSADVVYADGMPFIWLAKLCGLPVTAAHRTTFLDWESDFMKMAQRRGFKLFFVGGTADSLAGGLTSLRDDFPDLLVDGVSGFFDHEPGSVGTQEVIDTANTFGADIVLVGMGMPIQERWVAGVADRLDASLVLSLGAGLDYRSGEAVPPPRWLGRLGLEWLGRLLADPRRLGARYLVEPIGLIWPAVVEVRKHRPLSARRRSRLSQKNQLKQEQLPTESSGYG